MVEVSPNRSLRSGPTIVTEAQVYDVLYLDSRNRRSLVAAGLARDAACELARAEARRRGAGRMFLAGSEPMPRGEMILVVESAQRAA